MSWLAKSLVSSLSSDHSDQEGEDADPRNQSQEHGVEEEQPETPTRGVKEDISELTQTLTRQLWGFASFLSPPSPSPPPAELSPESPRIAGIRSDFAEIGGKLRSGISMLSNANAVSEISKIASSILPFGEEEEEEEEEEDVGVGIVGITEEVLAFARNISMHSETWLDFPAFHDDGDSNDFEMSDAQQEHAMSVEHLAPSLAALRTELCPSHMSEGCFWKIYFVLLHSRLSKHDAEILSTPQIVEARTMLLQDLQYQTKPVISEKSDIESSSKKDDVTAYPAEEKIILPSDTQNESGQLITSSFQEFTSNPVADRETEKHPLQTEIKIVDKSVIEEELSTGNESKDLPVESSEISIQRYEDDGEDWSEEETTDISNTRRTVIPLGPEEDVSFSDLEDYDDDDVDDQIKQISSKSRPDAISSQTSNPRGWVQLNKGSLGSKEGFSTSPETKESNDWLDIEDFDAE
ncbi:uncharacterized protein [Typha angustifolia]|uniref:uncharacterized protein n=1 Tax=Typha angustifolia TaxID=59011 RepID=UPI003C3038DE